MTVLGRPKIPVSTHPEHEVLFRALDIHGGLLSQELRQLGFSETIVESDSSPIVKAETLIGPLFLPAVKRHFMTEEHTYRSPGRTANAALDGAYMRLFIKRTPGNWDIGDPKLLGILSTSISIMPTVTLDNVKHYVCGKASGGGITQIGVRKYLDVMGNTIKKREARLLIVSPEIEKYNSLNRKFSDVLSVCQFSIGKAREENV